MSLETYTLIHVVISLIGIVSGLVVLFGMIGNKRLGGLTAVFLVTTVLTSLTGFGFPFKGVTPGIILGILSLVVLALSIAARYMFHTSGKWRFIYVITAVVALYFNCFVLVAQTFQKKILHTTGPASGPGFAATQGIVLSLFTVWGYLAVKNFHPEIKLVKDSKGT
ncbi:MAG TPA: hypothetical protein VKH81_06150 [Candidatus Angelobacter sp.]|nr:hypothetical protein [Candidatus Angelobacter sp.]